MGGRVHSATHLLHHRRVYDALNVLMAMDIIQKVRARMTDREDHMHPYMS